MVPGVRDSPATTADGSTRVRSTRLVGVDLARCLALVGMVTAHLLPGVVDGQVTLTHQVVAGRSSGLFAVLAGLAIVLLARSRAPVRGQAWHAEVAGAAARALGLGVLGLLLGLLDTAMPVILTYYAVLFLLATPFLALRTRWIAAWAAGILVVGPPLSQLVRAGLAPDAPGNPTPASLLAPVDLLQDLLLTGSFPALTWLPFVLAGMVVGRLDLRSTAVAQRLAGAGAALVLLAWALVRRPGAAARGSTPGWSAASRCRATTSTSARPDARVQGRGADRHLGVARRPGSALRGVVRPAERHRQRLPGHRCLPAPGAPGARPARRPWPAPGP